MFDLVAAVRAYPHFLPWCAGAQTRPRPDGTVEATLELDYRGVRSRFTTLNAHQVPVSIRMQLVDGPFRRLHGEWTFRALRADACKVHLTLHYQFSAGLLGRAIAPVFEAIAASQVDAFTRRADEVYGRT